MTGGMRLLRRPTVTVLWLAALTAAALLLAVGSGVLWSIIGLQSHMDQRFTSIAVLTRIEEQMEELENSMADGGVGVVLSAPVLSQRELEQIADMPQVRMVDVRGMMGAYSPSLIPVSSAETEKAYSPDLDTPYNRVMLVARVLQAETTRTPQEMDTTELDGQVHVYTEVRTRGKLAVEQVIAAHEAYDIPQEIDLDLLYVSEDPENGVQEGERYLFYGEYDAGLQHTLLDEIYEESGQEQERTPNLQVDDGVPLTTNYLQEDGTYCFVSSGDIEPRFPSFTLMQDRTDEFFADPEHQLWQKTREEMEITLHSVPLLGTDCLESVYAFQQGDSYLVEGRSFTQEEYRTGASVCVISEAVAKASGLSVGDSLTVSQYEALANYASYSDLAPTSYAAASGLLQRNQSGGAQLNNPFIRPYLSQYGFATQEETFNVVGIYRQEPWWDDAASFAMTPNVMFAPSKALAECAYRLDAGGVYLSVVLQNGQAQDFQQVAGELTTEGRWLVDDQNYAQVQAGVEQMQSAAKILMAACAVGWLVIMLFYLVLYQGGERRNLGIMISVGAGKGRAIRYLVGSGLILATVSTVLGLALSRAVDQAVLDMVLSVSMEQDSATAMSSASQLDTQLIAQVLAEGSAASWQGTAIIAILSLVVLGAALLVQAWLLSGQRPRKLMEG